MFFNIAAAAAAGAHTAEHGPTAEPGAGRGRGQQDQPEAPVAGAQLRRQQHQRRQELIWFSCHHLIELYYKQAYQLWVSHACSICM